MAKERRSMRNYSRRCLLNDSRRAKILNPISGDVCRKRRKSDRPCWYKKRPVNVIYYEYFNIHVTGSFKFV